MCLYADPLFDILLRSGLHGSCTAGVSAAGKRFFRHPPCRSYLIQGKLPHIVHTTHQCAGYWTERRGRNPNERLRRNKTGTAPQGSGTA